MCGWNMGVDGMMVVVYFLWLCFVCVYYVARGKNLTARAWERICRSQLPLDVLSTPQIAPMGGMIIEIKSTLQSQLCINEKKIIVVVEGELHA